MPDSRFARFAGVVLLLTGGLAHAADDEHMRVELVTVEAPAESKAKNIAQRVIALPVELVGLFFGHRAETPTIAGWPVATAYVGDANGNWDMPSNLLPPAPLARGDMVELDLSESRVAVWLSDDLNLQCDLDQDPAIARGDQFTLKLGMQFRFR